MNPIYRIYYKDWKSMISKNIMLFFRFLSWGICDFYISKKAHSKAQLAFNFNQMPISSGVFWTKKATEFKALPLKIPQLKQNKLKMV